MTKNAPYAYDIARGKMCRRGEIEIPDAIFFLLHGNCDTASIFESTEFVPRPIRKVIMSFPSVDMYVLINVDRRIQAIGVGENANHFVLTSSSRRLLDLLPLNDPYVRIIKSGTLGYLNHFHDGGLLVATLATKCENITCQLY